MEVAWPVAVVLASRRYLEINLSARVSLALRAKVVVIALIFSVMHAQAISINPIQGLRSAIRLV